MARKIMFLCFLQLLFINCHNRKKNPVETGYTKNGNKYTVEKNLWDSIVVSHHVIYFNKIIRIYYLNSDSLYRAYSMKDSAMEGDDVSYYNNGNLKSNTL